MSDPRTCSVCQSEAFRVRLHEGRTVFQCRQCSTAYAEDVEPHAAGEDTGAEAPAAPPRRAPAVAAAAPVAARKADAPIDVLKLAKARLRVVLRELRAKAKLERERDELTRLIAAAEGKPSAVVRALRAG